MSKEVDKATVFLTTKVRTKLKDDGSWLQQRSEPEKSQEEKPWLAEVRARRLNGAPVETGSTSSPTAPDPLPPKSDPEKAPTSGYLIRGVFTKLDQPAPSPPPPPVTTATTQYKKPSEAYKRIAPHTVRPSLESQEAGLSNEEQEKRKDAASKVLHKSAGRQRSYVFSAAKKYESKDEAPEPSHVNNTTSFVAKRVEITEDDENAVTPVSTPPPSPVLPVTSPSAPPEPQPRRITNSSIKTTSEDDAVAAEIEPVEEDTPLESVTAKDPFKNMTPGCTKVAMILPELPVCVQQVCADPELDDSDSHNDAHPESPPPATSRLSVTEETVNIEQNHGLKPEPDPEPEPSANPSSGIDTLTALSDTLISFDTGEKSSECAEPVPAVEEGGPVDSNTEDGTERNGFPPITDDLLAFTDGPEKSAEPVPPSPGRWSLDLLSGPDSPSTQREDEEEANETAGETQSPTETVTVTTKTVIVNDSSSADPFDPYPIGTTSPNSTSDLLQPLADISINSRSGNALESLADDVIPINTDNTSLSSGWSWRRSWNTVPAPQTDIEESPRTQEEGRTEEQQTLVMFECKSSENDSPWDRWTSPTVYTVTTGVEVEESSEDAPTHAVSPITTISYESGTAVENPRAPTPEPETKKGFVYVKEYVNATETQNTNDILSSGRDDQTSSSVNYSYSSPSAYSSTVLSSTCTYCGQLVGNDARITIDHLNINCHPACFKCDICGKLMGDLLFNMFLHGGKVHCESCYSKALD